MITLEARNVNYALPMGVDLIHRVGVREETRNGPALRSPVPVTTHYERPCERVMLHPWRDANPFFHLVEALWMIAGRDDLAPLKPYVARIADYSDDGGVTSPGAYGRRWRAWGWEAQGADHELDNYYSWGDQLDRAVQQLRANPGDRRVVVQMWDPAVDPSRSAAGGKDVPCNLTALPWVSPDGHLNLTVFCRSNDMTWGAYGANAVQFSLLLEYLAGRVGLPVGGYWQVSNNFHAYVETAGDPEACWPSDWAADPYASGVVKPMPLFEGWGLEGSYGSAELEARRERDLQQDLLVLFTEGTYACAQMARWPFLRRVAIPMMSAHAHWRGKKGADRYDGALEILGQMPVGNDWRAAGETWVKLRRGRWEQASDRGTP